MEEPAPDEQRIDRRVKLGSLALWIVGVGVVLVRSLDLFWYLFLSAYVLGILYALHLREVEDPEGDTAIWWALLVPPLAWWTFLLHWLEHRRAPPPDDAPPQDDLPEDPTSEDVPTAS